MIRSAPQTGYILLPVIVVITLVAAIALLMNTESALESNTAGSELDAQQAQYVAEAGMNHALWLARQQGCGAYSDLTSVSLGNDQYTTILTTDLGTATSYSITVDQDSWIRSDQPTINKATDLKMHIRNEAAGTEHALVRYDLSPIPANAPILSATAWFYITNAHAGGPIDVHLTTSDWAETDATWDSMSTNMDSAMLATIPDQPVTGIWLPVNLTAQVQAWINGQPNFGITLNSTVDGVHGQYNSRESANPPYLEVIVGTPPTSPALLKANGTLANGVTRDITRSDVILVQHPESFVQWQHDAVLGVDAYIWEFNPTTNYGIDDETWVSRSTNNTSLSLFKFDVDGLLPGTRILNATLSLHHESGNNPNVPVSAHRIINPWDEANVTWREREAGTDWDTYGGDFDDQVISNTLVGPTSNIRYEWDLTSLVQGWADNAYPNYGVALRTPQVGSIGERFYSSDETIETRRPRLTITYTCTCGEVCVMPQGSGNVLMPVSSSSNPTPDEVRRIELLESWGYVVDAMWEKNSQSNYNSRIANNDVVYVPATADANEVGTKLTNATIGVVNENGALNDELGIASGYASPIGTTINVSDNSHYITLPFALGPLNIFSAAMEGLTVSGAPSPDLQTLADWGGTGGLVVLDTGAALEGGGTAAGPRVLLPFGDDLIDFDHVNSNGRLILQRAIEWGAGGGSGCGSSRPLLLVVGSDSPLASKDDGRKSLMESWCYEVTVIDDGASQAEFDAAAAAADVVYVSGTIGGGALADKLTGSPAPIVNEFGGKLDNFGFSSSTSSSVSASTFAVTSPSHYISESFGGSAATVFTTSLTMPVPGGTLAPDLQTVGETSGAVPALVTLDTGAQRWDGNPAPARRVLLPFGSAETSQLTADGEILMRSALEWAGGAGCVDLRPLLLVVGDATTLSSKDDGMKNLMQSWCYSVTVIDDGASQASFDVAAAAVDMVYVSGTTSGPSLQDKLTGSPTPIVNEINGKLDNFGFSSSTASSVSASAFSATNASHYISEPFAGNPVTFFTTDLAMPVPGGTLAPDLQTVGDTTGSIPALVTLDIGAERWDSNPAPARRVHLPFTNAETSQLTADGETLMQRAIEWAWGADATGPIAHWKLDETSGTTAVDSVGSYDGTLINWPASPDWVTGKLDGGLSFDGSNDYIDVSSMNPLSYDDFTIVAWYKSADTSVSDDEYIFVHDDSFVDEFTFGPTDDPGEGDKLRLGLNRGGTWDPHYGTSDIVDQQWHHLVAVRSGGRIKLYVDGVEETDEADAHAGLTVTINGDGPFIGDYPGVTEQVHGILDDVRFYDRGLDATEIDDLFAAGGGLEGTFLDEFNAIAYDGDDGTLSWSNDWQETGESDGPGSGDFVVLNDSWCASGNCLRIREDRASTRRLSREVDMAGAASATLSLNYRRRHISSPIGGTITLEISDNGGSSFTPLKVYDMGTQDAVVQSDSFDISGYIASDTQLRFSTSNVLFETAMYVDNVLIDTTGGGGGGCAVTILDAFNAVGYSGSDADPLWVGDWVEFGDSGSPTSADEQVVADTSGFKLRIADNDNGGFGGNGEGVWREVDLSGMSTATLSYKFQREGLDNANDAGSLFVSGDGGTSWSLELWRTEGPGSDPTYQQADIDISAYIASNTRIRFQTGTGNRGSDRVYFDEVTICAN